MDEDELKRRTFQFALRAMKLAGALPNTIEGRTIGRQLCKAGTSVGANYRAACRGKSKADVVAKLAIVEEEANETLYWLELLIEAGIVPKEKLEPLMTETDEIVAMTVASIKTLRPAAGFTRQ